MNPYIWAVVGAIIGWLASNTMADKTFMGMVEVVGVGIFGAEIGGQVQQTMLAGPPVAHPAFDIGSVLAAAVGAAVMCGMLVFFRRAIGPLRHGKSRKKG